MSALPGVLIYGGAAGSAGEAIRGDDDASYVELPTIDNVSSYSFCGWARIVDADGNNHYPFAESKGSGFTAVAFGVVVQDTGDGSSITFTTGNGNAIPADAPAGHNWFFFAFRKQNSVIEVMWCYLAETEFDPNRTASNESSFGSGPATKCAVGAYAEEDGFSAFGGIDVCQIRRWKAFLTDEEFLAEKDSSVVVRTANLYSSNNFLGTSDLVDASGNGRDGTIVGTVVSVPDGPGNIG